MLNPGSYEDRRTTEARLGGLNVVFVVCFFALAVAFWILQVVQNQKYAEMAANNHLRTIALRAPRGVLFDRDGRVLVENRYSFTISIVREQSAHPEDTLHLVAQVTGVDEARIRDAYQRRRKEPTFRPLPVVENATFEQVAAVLAHHLEMPEIEVQQVPTRTYPPLASHLFGYVGEIQESQLASGEYPNLQSGAIVGQAGIEKVYNAELMGTDGNKFVVVNSKGREIEELKNLRENPTDGQRMQLTIDADVQRAMQDAYEVTGIAGAGVVMDPRTGEILAMTSQPEYDPNDFATGIDRATWSELNTDPQKPLQNRLIQGRYQPGSTFKIVVAMAALSEGIITPDTKVYCPGSITLYGHTFHCDKKEGHGTLDLRHALEQSCDVYFYKVGSMMNIDTIHEYAQKLGLVGKTGIDLPSEVESIIPSTEWKLKTTGERWYPGETVSVAIGQGQVSVTPIALATMISTIANGGTVVTPHFVKARDEGHGWEPMAVPAPRSVLPLNPAALQPVRDGLWLAVNGAGTAFRAKIDGHDVVGKTGTAQVVSLENAKLAAKAGLNVKDNSWFVFYAPKDNPEVAGVVFGEHAGFGASGAVPIARHLLETYFAKREGRPLPHAEIGADKILKSVPGPAPAPASPKVPVSTPPATGVPIAQAKASTPGVNR